MAVICIALGASPAANAEVTAPDGARGSLRAVSLLFRHSVISPKYQLPKVKTEWSMGYRQLTAVGIHHMYRIGQSLRRKYVTELGLIAGRHRISEIYARASNTDRGLQSAQTLMLGMFPLGTGPDPASYDKSLTAIPAPGMALAPVPIHATSLADDTILRPWTRQAKCTKYRKYVKSLRKTRTYRKQAKRFKRFLLRMAAATGINEGRKPVRILHKINEIYEPLSANVQHMLPLPKAISARDMETLKALADWNYHHQFLGKQVGRLTGGPFVGEVVENFERTIAKSSDARRLYLYSGHQRTMLGVEAALGIEEARTKGRLFEGRVPPLGSRYAFELHEADSGRFAVRLSFVTGDQAEKTIRIPGCPRGMCPFARFKAIAAKVVPKDWAAECNS